MTEPVQRTTERINATQSGLKQVRCAGAAALLAAAMWLNGCTWRQDAAGLGEAWDGVKNLAAPQQSAISPKAQSIEKELQR